MKSAIVAVCLSLFVASHAFILGQDGIGGLMALNMLSNRNALDMSMFGLGGGNQQQGQAASAQGAAGSAAAASGQGASTTNNQNSGGLFSNPWIQLSMLRGDGFFF